MPNDDKKFENAPQTASKVPFYTFLINLVKPFKLEKLKKAFSRLPKGASIGETVAPISGSEPLARAPKWMSLRRTMPKVWDSQTAINPYVQLLHQQAALKIPVVSIKESVEMDFLKNIGMHQETLARQKHRLPSPIDFKQADLQGILDRQSDLLREALNENKIHIKNQAQQNVNLLKNRK